MNGLWCSTLNHEAQHFIVNGEAACKTARPGRWVKWQVLPVDEIDQTKQCCRCKGWVAANPPKTEDLSEKMRELGRLGGMKGGKASTPAKRRAARLRERMKRKHKAALCSAG